MSGTTKESSMTAMKVLVSAASKHGATAEIAGQLVASEV